MIELAKAIAIARLEIESEYSEARHDVFFAEFSENNLDQEDLALFPDYLICLRAADLRRDGQRSAPAGLRRWHAD